MMIITHKRTFISAIDFPILYAISCSKHDLTKSQTAALIHIFVTSLDEPITNKWISLFIYFHNLSMEKLPFSIAELGKTYIKLILKKSNHISYCIYLEMQQKRNKYGLCTIYGRLVYVWWTQNFFSQNKYKKIVKKFCVWIDRSTKTSG